LTLLKIEKVLLSASPAVPERGVKGVVLARQNRQYGVIQKHIWSEGRDPGHVLDIEKGEGRGSGMLIEKQNFPTLN